MRENEISPASTDTGTPMAGASRIERVAMAMLEAA
jgi:hypothetical protein